MNPCPVSFHPRPLRGHLQKETGDQTVCQLHSETQERTQEVTSSSGEGREEVNLFHTLHVGGMGRSAT